MDCKIISFDLAKINRGKEKLCNCAEPHYEIDTVNRLVMCTDCWAIVDPFDALLSFTERMDEIEELQNKMFENIRKYKKAADAESKRLIKNKVFREMDEEYKLGGFPVCPKCNNVFDPTKITRWVNKNFPNI